MTTSESTVIVPFQDAINQVRTLNIPNRQAIEQLAQSALNMVILDLEANNFAGAIDTMQKTRAIEEYLKAKIKQQHVTQVAANTVTAARFDMLREIGWWLDENLARTNRLTIAVHGDGKPKFFLDDLGISDKQSEYWQRFARISVEEYEPWKQKFLQDGDGREVPELRWGLLWALANPRQAKEQVQEVEKPDIELSPAGMKFYRWINDGKRIVVDYLNTFDPRKSTRAEVLFLVKMGIDLIAGLTSAVGQLKKITDASNEQG